jgi:hypothetical protein
MKRAAAAKSCGSTVSAKSKNAWPWAVAAGSAIRQSRICVRAQKYQLTRDANEFRQYRGRGAALLVKYSQVYHHKSDIKFTSISSITTKNTTISNNHTVSTEL